MIAERKKEKKLNAGSFEVMANDFLRLEKKVKDIEEFKKQISDIILKDIKDSRSIESEIKKIVWKTIKTKIIWIILGGFGLIFTNLVSGIAIYFITR